MYVESTKNNGTRYLRLVRSVRVRSASGDMKVVKKTVLNIGPLSRFDDGQPDYLARLRQSFRDGKPLIDMLVPYVGEAPKERWRVVFDAGDEKCLGRPKRMARTILDPVFSALGLDALLASVKHASKLRYDLAGIVRLLTYGRILEPASKSATMSQNDKWLDPPVGSGNDDNVYDALTVVERNRKQILRRMNACVTRGTGRRGEVVFYDCTNFFFEIGEGDADDVRENVYENGAVETIVLDRGLRKRGVSKENRRGPIVQMGLFLDGQGIPISIEEFPGNTLDAQTLGKAMRSTVANFDTGRFVLVADRGMYSGTNVREALDGKNGYIVSKSLLKSAAKERTWATGPKGWETVRDDFKCKSRVLTRTMLDGDGNEVLDEDGKPRTYQEKVVVYWSRSFYERQLHENKSFLGFVDRLKANPAGFRVNAAQSRSLRKFLKKEVYNAKTGEVLDGSKLRAMIDDNKLDAFKELMGYYQIVSSETKMPSAEIIEKYHGLTRIEDQFREMKGTLETRPVYVRTKEHVKAHLLVCFIALTMLRLIQRKVRASMPEVSQGDVKWSYGIPGARIAAALRDWQSNELPGGLFQMLNADGKDIGAILGSFGISIPARLYTRGEMRELKSSIDPF